MRKKGLFPPLPPSQSVKNFYHIQNIGVPHLSYGNGHSDRLLGSARPLRHASGGGAGQALTLFVGSAHAPNATAVELLKTVAAQLPQVYFFIVGSVCQMPDMRKNAPLNMIFVGQLDEAQKNLLLAAMDAGLNPVTTGAGSNLKVVEYMAAGMAVVSTAHGLRGMAEELRTTVHIAASEDFAKAVTAALRTPPGEAQSRQTAQAAAEQLSWQTIMLPVRKILHSILTAGEQ